MVKFLKREVHGYTVGAWIFFFIWIGVIFWTIGWVNFLFHFGFRFGIVGLVFFIPWAWSFDWKAWATSRSAAQQPGERLQEAERARTREVG